MKDAYRAMDDVRPAVIPGAATVRVAARPRPGMTGLALAAILLAAVPLVISEPAPLEDWPSHLARVEILSSLLRGETFWSQYYYLNSFLLPNVALDAGLIGLHALGPSIATAGTIFLLATYALFIVGGIRLAAAFGASDPVKPQIIAMLFYNGGLMGGFVNYMVGLGLAFCVLAAWIRARDRPVRALAVAVIGTLAVFFAHLIAAGFLILAMGLIELHRLLQQRRFGLTTLLRHASPVPAGAVIVVLFAMTPTTADGPGGGGPIVYTGAPSPLAIAKGKLILLFHPLLDGSGITGAAIVAGGMGLFLLLVLRFGHPRLRGAALFLSLGLVCLVLVSPYEIGAGFGLDYRLVVPLACVVVCGTSLAWRGSAVRWVAFGVLLSTSIARSGAFTVDFYREHAIYRSFATAVRAIPPDSVLLTGMGARWDAIPWDRFWAPPSEHLDSQAAAAHVLVPAVFAIASQHPLILNRRFADWGSFLFFGSSEDAAKSRVRLGAICADWRSLGHTGRVMMLLVYPSAVSELLIPRSMVIASDPGFELVDGCGLSLPAAS